MKSALLPLLVLLLTACATSPLGRHQFVLIPAAEMDQMGVTAFTQMKQKEPTETGTKQSHYVTCVANAITGVAQTGEHWDVVLFKSKEVNAFALPGGKIGVYTGLLKVAKTQDQLAAVLGHEVGHVLAQHANERLSLQYATQTGAQLIAIAAGGEPGQQQTLLNLLGVGVQYGVALPFSRTQESEADLIGLQLMAQAGFDPRQAVQLWKNMDAQGGAQPPEFLSTHPSNASRIEDLQAHLPRAEQLYRQARAAGHSPHCS